MDEDNDKTLYPCEFNEIWEAIVVQLEESEDRGQQRLTEFKTWLRKNNMHDENNKQEYDFDSFNQLFSNLKQKFQLDMEDIHARIY